MFNFWSVSMPIIHAGPGVTMLLDAGLQAEMGAVTQSSSFWDSEVPSGVHFLYSKSQCLTPQPEFWATPLWPSLPWHVYKHRPVTVNFHWISSRGSGPPTELQNLKKEEPWLTGPLSALYHPRHRPHEMRWKQVDPAEISSHSCRILDRRGANFPRGR